ncbi:hypothetical protein A4A49_27343 [Nicotiana attenuata]|uniref:Uncharacterized protein n=1 Tax=Nicotiana attenuata TaxID=49451 RepID=A0A314L4U1_NICAT|nr:hypothetical protein A4A49_27343 [Nicotiana attenuata]
MHRNQPAGIEDATARVVASATNQNNGGLIVPSTPQAQVDTNNGQATPTAHTQSQVQANPQALPTPNTTPVALSNSNKAKIPNNPSPPPTVTQSYVTRLRARHEAEISPLQFISPVITTKQGKHAVIFKREDYMVKFADRLWSKQHMYIQVQLMRIEAWNPIFKPNEDSPIVPIWIMIPEFPWHLYYMEILTPLLSPIGKALFLDLASFQKTRGSVVKAKMLIDLTKERLTHVWLGYDEDQDGKHIERQEGEPLGVGFPHVLHECANAQLTDPRLDHLSPATTAHNQDNHDEADLCEIISFEEEKSTEENDQIRRLLKGKAHASTDFNIQPPNGEEANDAELSPVSYEELEQSQEEIPNPSKYKPTPAPGNITKEYHHIHPLEAVLEECPLNRYSSQEDEYRPILSEDDMYGEGDEEVNFRDEAEEEQHCDLLVAALHGATDQETTTSQRSNIRFSPRITRSKAARSNNFSAKVLDHVEQQMTLAMRHVASDITFNVAVIYAKCKIVMRRPLWEVLRHKSTTYTNPWCVIGDLNVIASVDEKIATTVSHFAAAGSDHNPLLLEIKAREDSGKKYFRFLNCWVNNKKFLPLVKEIWDKEVHGKAMWIFHQKLKTLSNALSTWSRQEYGDIFQKSKEYEQQVKDAEMVWANTNEEAD